MNTIRKYLLVIIITAVPILTFAQSNFIASVSDSADIKEQLLKLGCSESQMSGSGSSVFGVVKHKTDAEEILRKIKSGYAQSYLVENVDKGVEIVSVN